MCVKGGYEVWKNELGETEQQRQSGRESKSERERE